MKTKNSYVRYRNNRRKLALRFRSDRLGARFGSMLLAAVMVFALVGANAASIVDFVGAFADSSTHDETSTYSADLTLYDYYSDQDLGNGSNYNGDFDYFNMALYDSGYVSAAGTWGSLAYYPLYVGAKTSSWSSGTLKSSDAYNYSAIANSEVQNTTDSDGNTVGMAAQDLVDSTLHGGEITQGNGTWILPYFNEEFLTAPIASVLTQKSISSKSTIGRVKDNLTFNFTKNSSTGYYEYQSSSMGLDYNSGTFTANDDGTKQYDTKGGSGFFPWNYVDGNTSSWDTAGEANGYNNTNNYGYGAKFEIEFTMNSSGTSGADDIEFNFTGDDDVWVFIDGYLVLDVGGSHSQVTGTINFNSDSPKATVSYVKTGSKDSHSASSSAYTADAETSLSDIFDNIGLYDDVTANHTLTIYYIERGYYESNCYISFNFEVGDTVEVVNTLNTTGVNDFFLNEVTTVAASESAEFVIASNGGTASGSPDATKSTDTNYPWGYDADGNVDYTSTMGTTAATYTVTFYSETKDSGGGSVYKSYTKLASGTTIAVPKGYNLSVPDGYEFSCWADEDGNKLDSTSITVSSNLTYYPIFELKPVSLSTVYAPAISYYNGYVYEYNSGYTAEITGKSGNSTRYYSSNVLVVNSTYGVGGGSTSSWFKISGSTQYDYSLQAGYVTVVGSSSSKYDVSSKSNYSSYVNSTVASWIDAYYNVYSSLVTYKSQIEDLSTKTSVSSLETLYNTALTAYYDECYAGSSSVSSDLSTALSNLATAIEKASYTSSYTTSGSVTFYVYASSTPTVTVSSPSGVSVTPTVTSISNPSGASDAIDGYSYYSVTVPTTYTETKTYTSGTTATETGDITYTIDGTSYTSSELASYYSSNYCYDAYMSDWRELTEETSTTSYAYSSDTTLVWVYATSEITVTYSATDSSYGLETVTASAESDSYIPTGFYAYLIPSEVEETSGTTTTGLGASSVTVTVNGTGIDFTKASDTTCFIGTSTNLNGELSKGSYYPVYAVTYGATTYNYAYAYNSSDYPTSTSGYGAWGSNGGIAMTLDSKYSSNYYTWFPYTSGVTIILSANGSDSTRTTVTLQAKDYNYKDSSEVTSSSWDYYMTPSYFASQINSTTSSASLTATASLMTASVEEEEESASEDDSSETASVSATVSDSNLLASTANTTTTLGQYAGTQGTYSYATATNFKLFVDYNDKDNSVIRQTEVDGDGGFYLRFGQSAKFTAQFVRDYGLKISATGNYFTNTDSTSAAALSQVTPTSSDGEAQTDMYKKYSTTWVLTDSNDVKITSDDYKYGVNLTDDYTASDTLTSNQKGVASNNAASEYAIYFDNLATDASSDTGIYLTATYTSTVITSDLLITKSFTTAAKEAIATAQKSDSTYDPEFTFVLKFSKIFGGSSSEEVYTGSYSIVKIASDSSSYSYEVVSTGTADSSGITLTYSQLVNGYGILIEGVPVETNYAIDEYFPTDTTTTTAGINFAISSSTSATSCKVDTSATSVTVGSTSATPTVSNGTTYSEVTGTVTAVLVAETDATETGTGDVTGEIATYYDVDGNNADWWVTVVNDLGNYYIQITKTINELYYGGSDNPAGLFGTGALIGGATSAATDSDPNPGPNGYESATGAEQTFIFKITDSGGESFYVTLSFGKDAKIGTVSTSYDDDGNPYYTTTYTASTAKILVDATKTYTVSEVTDWSWKYTLSGASVSPSSSNNSVSDSYVVTIKDYDSTNTATATFSNVKKDDGTEDIEGDTAVVTNKIIKPSSAA